MSNVLIGWGDWGDNATVADQSSEVSGFGAEELLTEQPTDFWEAASGTGEYVELDRGSVAPWNVVALLFTNLSDAATWRVRAANDQASLTDGTADHDSGDIAFRVVGDDDTWDRHHGFHFISGGVSRRWLRIDIDDSSNPDSAVRAGRLVVGNLLQPAVNDAYPRRFGFRDPNNTTRTEAGALRSTTGRKTFLAAELRLDFLSEADVFNWLLDFRRRRGTHQGMLAVLDPEASTVSMTLDFLTQTYTLSLEEQHLVREGLIYGKFARDEDFVLPDFDRYQHRITIEEML